RQVWPCTTNWMRSVPRLTSTRRRQKITRAAKRRFIAVREGERATPRFYLYGTSGPLARERIQATIRRSPVRGDASRVLQTPSGRLPARRLYREVVPGGRRVLQGILPIIPMRVPAPDRPGMPAARDGPGPTRWRGYRPAFARHRPAPDRRSLAAAATGTGRHPCSPAPPDTTPRSHPRIARPDGPVLRPEADEAGRVGRWLRRRVPPPGAAHRGRGRPCPHTGPSGRRHPHRRAPGPRSDRIRGRPP